MGGANYYLVTALPRMGALGSDPPMRLRDMLRHAADGAVARELVTAVLLADDLMKRQAILAGELEQAEGVILTDAQLRDEAPLPGHLAPPGRQDDPGAPDAVWSAYFRHAAATAASTGSEFLAAWVGYEVGLRNALAEARARALGLEGANYLVATDLSAGEMEFSAAIAEWSSAADPLEASKALDRARWNWLAQHDGWFSFSDDELAAYAAKLALLHRWRRMTGEQ